MRNETAQLIATMPVKVGIAARKQIEDQSKKVSTSYLLMILPSLFWVSGCHKFYKGDTGLGFAYLLTLGFLGLGNLYDLFMIPSQIKSYNDKVEAGVLLSFQEYIEE